MVRKLALINLWSVILAIAVNYISQTLRMNGTTIAEMSGRYNGLFTPANYAFSIWGLIFLGLLAFALFQVRRAFFSQKKSDFIEQTGYWFSIANIFNASWVFAFVYDYTGLSIIIMLVILFSLIKIILNTNMERWDAPIEIIAFVWWPICLYSGWIAVATIANIAAYLTKLGWDGGPFSEETWTILLIVVATVLNLLMIWKRNMREFAAVGIWALIGIFIRHQENMENIANVALAGSIIIFIYAAIHGYQNRKTNPVYKLMERFKK
ncbi:MAG: tryptophan-rich sensory protein [Pricia sp.]|nr:tryptophan-rich sensory protein [Pricia sp.]